MTPAARLQAAIEILDAVIAAARAGGAPAERVVAEGLRARRYAGSGDRRAIREHVFAAIRACGPVPASGRAALLRVADRALFDGSAHGPAPLAAGEQAADGGVAPLWLAQRLAASGLAAEAAEALLGRAALDIRVNAARADRAALALPVAGEALAFTRQGLRLPAGTPVEQWEAYAQGLIEVQDAGSQLACGVVAARPG
ncbi:MAG TPA: RsmB/NOP family class I SAM-dependent RNA methyltransferase, partial [Novosphingobium sp.]|nr:RsmB/NOP family class I SAM-dependent RNA methyltransferase [Novosphingobium sp.]